MVQDKRSGTWLGLMCPQHQEQSLAQNGCSRRSEWTNPPRRLDPRGFLPMPCSGGSSGSHTGSGVLSAARETGRKHAGGSQLCCWDPRAHLRLWRAESPPRWAGVPVQLAHGPGCPLTTPSLFSHPQSGNNRGPYPIPPPRHTVIKGARGLRVLAREPGGPAADLGGAPGAWAGRVSV